MSMVFPTQQPTYSQLFSQLKSKNKQIRFLQDKIVLMQKERQTKISDLSSKYSQALQQHNLTITLVQESNSQLKAKLAKAKQRMTQLQQTHTQQSHQIKHLTDLNTTYTKQIKSLKSKYQRERHHNALLQQQSLNMKSIINVMEKQLRELTKKNLELIEQKNTLMMTYNDYDQVKWKLGEIHGVYEQQYEEEVRLVKERLRSEMGMVVRREETAERLESDKKINEKSQLVETKADLGCMTKDRTCQKCLLEASWSEDLIKLSNLVQYGPEYLLSLVKSPNNIIGNICDNSEPQICDTSFNYQKTQKILSFISEVIRSNEDLKSLIKEQQQRARQIKCQLQQKISQLLDQITSLQQQQHKTSKQSKQSLQQLYQSLNQINRNSLTSNESFNKISTENYRLKQQVQSGNLVMNSLIRISSRLIGKCEELRVKTSITERVNSIEYTDKGDSIQYNKKKSTKSNKLKHAMLSVFFIMVIKKTSQKLKRKTKLHYGIKPYAIKKTFQTQLSQTSSVQSPFQQPSLSLNSLIFPTQAHTNSLLSNSLSQSYQFNLLKRCVYQIKREQIMKGKRNNANNNILTELIDKVGLTKDNELWSLVYRSLVQMVYMESFKGDW